jgi:predicted dehydrogenase
MLEGELLVPEASQKQCRVAFVGGGAMAREHIRAFADIPGASLAGIANRTESKASALATEFGLPFVTSGIDRLYEETKADVVQVSVYETAILPVMRQVLAHPWTVLMEKPVGLNVAEAEAILAEASERGRQVYVGLNRRAISSTRAVLEDVRDDPAPRYIRVQDQQSLATARAIGHDERVVDAWMYANSIHLVDYLLAFGRGSIVSVDVIEPWRPRDPGVVIAKVAFSSGDIGLYEAIWNAPGPWACTVSTPRRRWELRPLERASYVDAGSRAVVAVDPDPVDGTYKPGFRLQAEWMVAERAGQKTPLPSLAEGVAAMRLTQRIYEPQP